MKLVQRFPYYGRPADPLGLQYWSNEIEKAGGKIDAVVNAFGNSDEAKAIYGDLGLAAQINNVYQNILGRPAETGGLTWYAQEIQAGRITLAGLAQAVIAGASGADATVVANKLVVAKAFTDAVDDSAQSIVAYNGEAAADIARDFLATVTADTASVTAATGNIASTVSSLNGALTGETFTLTAGADTPAATSGNDTINALTIDATGAAAETFSSFDNIDGGAGTDTLNIYTTATLNEGFPTSATVKNVEIINLFNSSTTANQQFGTTAAVDASKFAGATQIWQIGAANNNGIANVAATTTAGLRNLTADDTVNTSVAAASGATSVNVALDAVKGKATTNVVTLGVSGDAVAAVNVSGTIAQQTVNATAASLALGVTAGKDVETLTLNSAVKTTVSITEGAGSTKEIKTVDASASTGGITYAGTVTGGTVAPATIKTGAGADTVTIATATTKDDATTAADETVSALLETGAGKDGITINTTGTGTTTVNAGDGNDTVTLTADGSGKLTVNLGAGDDTFTGAGSVAGTDLIDGGDGTDTLLLNMVGAANIGAFSNFETFDAAGLAKTLDVDILATKNTVTEFVATADVGGSAVLTNLGAGVNFRATGDMTTNALTLTQKTAGALTVTLDADSTSTTAQNDTNLKAVASNATSLKAVFAADSGYNDPTVNTNDQTITLTGTKATALEVVSGGTNATNTLAYTSGVSATAGKDLLASITISGDKALSVTVTESAANASQVTSINASALTGALTISTAELKAESAANTFDGGVLTLGSGADVITITQGAVISGLAKGTAEGATAQGAFDVLKTGSAVAQAADDVSTTDPVSVKDGLLTFNGAGPATLDAALTLVATQLGNANAGAAVVFEYVGNSYVYVDNTNDVVVKLAGVTGLTGLGEVGTTDNLYVF